MEIKFLWQVVESEFCIRVRVSAEYKTAESEFCIGSLFCSADFLFGLLIFKLFLGLALDGITTGTSGIDSEIGCSGF